MASINLQKYRLSQQYGLISLLAIAATAILIFIFFRGQTIQTIETASEGSYTTLALALTNTMNDHFIEYVNKIGAQNDNDNHTLRLHPDLEIAIQKLIKNNRIARVKIYDRNGKVIYSSKRSQLGNIQNDNPGYISAINGRPASKFIHHDTLNVFGADSEDANLVQSYVPIWHERSSKPIGVFEIYADMNNQISASVKSQLTVLMFVLVAMLGLYTALMFYIRRAEKIIVEKQLESRKRQKTLEILSAKMISAQEDEKKRISAELHEDVVQTITAVKMHLEQCILSARQNQANVPLEVPSHIIPVLQESISKIRALSINLRPPSLDEFGLKAATNTLVSDFNSMPCNLNIRVNINVDEKTLSEDKKSILYRILSDTLKMIAVHKNSEGEIQINLGVDNLSGNLNLAINYVTSKHKGIASYDLCDTGDFEMMRESTILSGGDFKVFKDSVGSIMALSEWEAI